MNPPEINPVPWLFQSNKCISEIPFSSLQYVLHTMKMLENRAFLASPSVNRLCAASNNRTGFLCDDRATCVPASQVCNGVSNCRNGEDEQGELCGEWFFCHCPLHAGLSVVKQSSQCPSNPASRFWTHTRADEPGRSFVGQRQCCPKPSGSARNQRPQAPLTFLGLFFQAMMLFSSVF